MSKMKHLLRKLHIGGGGAIADGSSGSYHHHQHSRSSASDLPQAKHQPAAATPASSSSSSLLASTSSAPVAAAVGEVAEPSGNGSGAGDVALMTAVAAVRNGAGDFSFFEEEYQVQLALAISASDPNGLEDPDAVQMKAAKQISLGCSPANTAAVADVNRMEYLSIQYWNYNVVDYDEKLMDGFYDVYGIMSDHQLQGQIPSLVDLQAISVTDSIEYEVVIVNRSMDHELQKLEKRALAIASDSRKALADPIASGLVQKLANLVVDSMGGPVADTEDILRRWRIKSRELQTSLRTIVLPLGSLKVGLSRHRALLFKVLADLINLPARLVKGSYYTGTDEGAVNFIKVDYDSEFMIDLMGAPGTLVPAEVPSRHLQTSGLNLVTPSTIEQTVKVLRLGLNNMGCQFDRKSDAAEESASSDSFRSITLHAEEKSFDSSKPKGDNLTKNQAENFETEQRPFPPFGMSQLDLSSVGESPSSVQQMKVNDVVVSAARNPVFAQKLHAVLLESGASPPSDLFSDLNHSEYHMEHSNNLGVFGEEEVSKLPQQSVASVLLTSMVEEFSSSADVINKQNLGYGNACTSQSPFDTNLAPCCLINDTDLEVFDSKGGGALYCEAKGKVANLISDRLVASGATVNYGSKLSLIPYRGNLILNNPPGASEAPVPFESSKKLATLKDTEIIENCEESHVGKNNKELHGSGGASDGRPYPMLNDVADWEIPWEDLQIGERIGLGSYGEVYRADWNGTEVAVKKFLDQDLSGDALEQFRCEVKLMLRMRHPNVVLFMGAVTQPPNLSILTEFLPRGSLYRLLHRSNSQLDEKRRLKMVVDVARGMNYLHASHPTIVHRDLKSPNLLVDKNWVVKVCDFGLSRIKHSTFLSSRSTAGTPEWMAPEILRNERSNEKCDVYSFGVILWELATLRIPWSGMNPMQVVGAVGFQNRHLDIPKEVDPMVAEIIRDCWRSDPSERPSFAQLMSPLKKLQRLVVADG